MLEEFFHCNDKKNAVFVSNGVGAFVLSIKILRVHYIAPSTLAYLGKFLTKNIGNMDMKKFTKNIEKMLCSLSICFKHLNALKG